LTQNAQAQRDSAHSHSAVNPRLLLSYNMSKSLYHLAFGGYSIDPEVKFIIPSQKYPRGITIGFAGGKTKFFRKKNTTGNWANYASEGFYLNPQLGVLFTEESSNISFLGSLGFIYSRFDESIQPFIEGGNFDDFYGEPIQTLNQQTWGGDINLDVLFRFKSRFSLMLNIRTALVYYPQENRDPLIRELPIFHIPGVGDRISTRRIFTGSGMFLSMGFGIKGVFIVF
jgi:hypothetical protein